MVNVLRKTSLSEYRFFKNKNTRPYDYEDFQYSFVCSKKYIYINSLKYQRCSVSLNCYHG